jgi:EAL domain-containing protein (putative c-di-GMP-specific phosphodiesterase class I)
VPLTRVEYVAGQIIFREGDAPDVAYLVEAGEVVVSADRNGASVILAILRTGDLLGEMAVIDDAPRTATATARSHCVLMTIDRAAISERLESTDPIIRGLLEGQIKRYRSGLAAMQGLSAPVMRPSRLVFGNSSERAGIDKFRLESELREALSSGQLDVSFQPLLEVATDRIAGYEALVRWPHPERGAISPIEFISLAEETSLINPVGEYVLNRAIGALTRLADAGLDPLPFIAINVSPKQLMESDLLNRTVDRTRAAGVPVNRIKLEITESRMVDYPTVQALLVRCHREGIEVSLDDFGTGFSNLGHLHALEFDTVKVDQAFARHMMTSRRAMALAKSIINMIHALDADVVVEGVETEAQMQVLRAMGCRYAQGYLVGRPQPLGDVLAAWAR